jgi:siroheme synthase (precorrin-2 oxidase/ferrochelatase)
MNTNNQKPIDSNITSGESLSYWVASSKPIIFSKVDKSMETDVLIIGGGISGLTTAYCLAKAGKKVMLSVLNATASGLGKRSNRFKLKFFCKRYFVVSP